MLLLPAGVTQLLARERIDDAGFDAMDDAARFARGGYQVIPASGDMAVRLKTEYAIGKGIALVVIEEQPPVKVFAAQSFLNASQIHAIRE